MDKNSLRVIPQVNNIKQSEDSVLLSLHISDDLKCFKGHFDEAPVVPGVVQLDWAIHFARQQLSMVGNVMDVSVLKFQKLLTPDTEVELEVIKKSATKFTFSYSSGEDKFSSARVELS